MDSTTDNERKDYPKRTANNGPSYFPTFLRLMSEFMTRIGLYVYVSSLKAIEVYVSDNIDKQIYGMRTMKIHERFAQYKSHSDVLNLIIKANALNHDISKLRQVASSCAKMRQVAPSCAESCQAHINHDIYERIVNKNKKRTGNVSCVLQL